MRGIGRVVYIPGDAPRSVTTNGAKDVTRQYRAPDPRAETPRHARSVTPKARPDWTGHGILAVAAVLALGVIADGATLLLAAWWNL